VRAVTGLGQSEARAVVRFGGSVKRAEASDGQGHVAGQSFLGRSLGAEEKMKKNPPKAGGLGIKMEEARVHIMQNFDRYFRASDFLTPRGKLALKQMRNIQLPPTLFAWLWKYRDLPKEVIPYPIAWDNEGAVAVFSAMAEWNSLRNMSAWIAAATGLEVDREEIIRWLYGKPVPEEVRALFLRETGG